MESRVSYTLVGAFVLIFGAGIVSVTLWLAAGIEDKEYERYVAYVSESVSGLNPRAPVKYRGVGVGLVAGIALDRDNPERVRLLLDIERGTPIKEDTTATVATQGITGIAFVELSGGSREAADLSAREGDRYPEISTTPSVFVRLDTAVTGMLAEMTAVARDLSTLTERVSKLLDDDKQAAFGNTLANVEQITATLAARVEVLAGDGSRIDTILDNTVTVSAQLPAVVERLNDVLGSVDTMVQSIDGTANTLSEAVGRSERRFERATDDLLGEIAPLLSEMRGLGIALERAVRDLERSPEGFLFGRDRGRLGPGEEK
ncbi:MAG: MlaD family protein [Gammaproteobacteria bacterium]